ncbi:carbamate kinase [Kitasatospora mediocidica]|uniref:carbamate kinase n=1 Tax=Kitasatospora mediocidica TaxID=58352 RepID=UPI0005633FA0|nr:carbamate kinase [Kitasatospora mediocidica]
MRIVVALGGNALLPRGQHPDAEPQALRVTEAARALAPLARDHELVITHGNGPQVGLLAMESAADPALAHPYPIDVLGAETQGMIGYWLIQGLHNALPGRQVACLLNQTVVSANDPAFHSPTKFVGPVWTESEARRQAAERGWAIARDGEHWRRVVASPEPRRVAEAGLIRLLLDAGAVTVCAGGGGIPVVEHADGQLTGTEAVVDKDLTAALLAEEVKADFLLILTDVPHVVAGYGTPKARPLHTTTPRELRSLAFPPGSMGPKVEAAARFVEHTGAMAAIGPLSDVHGILQSTTGTYVRPDRPI